MFAGVCAAPDVEVVGPVEGDRPPFGAPAAEVLQRHDYVCEEYCLAGEAAAYTVAAGRSLTSDGRWDAVPFAVGSYRTRLLVLRPRRATAFTGTVLLNWQNVSAGVERPAPADGEVYRGHAWVGVSAQMAGLYGLPRRRGNPARGAPLLDADPQRYAGLVHPGDAASFDVFSAAAGAVGPRRSGGVDPMGGLPVARVVALGGSQSAMRLCAYANAVHPLHRVVDAFLLSVWEGRAPRLDAADESLHRRTTVRDDLDVPVLVVNSEFEVPATAVLDLADTDLRRVWEVAGAPHGTARSPGRPPDGEWGPNPISWQPVHEAAIRAVHAWLAADRAPVAQPRITTTGRQPSTIVRDEGGNAWGGIRLPEIAVPIGEYRGRKGGTGRAPVFGGWRRYPTEVLRSRYRSAGDYGARWADAVDDLAASGVLLPEDVPEVLARGAEVADALPLG